MVTRRLATFVMVLMLAVGSGGLALAQDDGPSPDSPTKDRDDGGSDADKDAPAEDDATPEAEDGPLPTAPDGPLDLAAMTLDSDDLPQGYQLAGESYVDLDQLEQSLSEVATPDELDALGIVGYYETTYVLADASGQIRSYAIEYPDANAAEDGFALLEDEDRMVPDDGDLQDQPGPAGVGEEPSEITTGVFGQAGAETTSVDVTFRVDRLGVGVAVETFDGSEPDQDAAEELAATLEARVAAALSGDDVAGVDPTLPSLMVTFEGETTFEGYQTVVDGYGDPGSSAGDGFVSSYVRGASFSDDLATTIAPFVTVGVSRYEDDGSALALLENPDAIALQFPGLAEIDVPLVGGSPTAGVSFESLIEGDDLASVRLFVAVDDVLLSVDAQGFATTDDAISAALDVAETAVGCAEGGDCGPVGLPASSSGDDDADATPTSPFPDDENDDPEL